MEELIIKRKTYHIESIRFENDSFIEFLTTFKNKKYLVRKYKIESEFTEALYRYKKIYSYGIYTPMLRVKDKKEFILVFDYIEGETMAEVLSKGDIPENVFTKLFTFYRYCRANQIEINYLPENFIVNDKKLYYTSLELFPKNPDINLENYGIEFWIMSQKGYDHLIQLGYKVDKKRVLARGEANKKLVLLSLLNW